MSQPHPDPTPRIVACVLLTISDTRTPETDKSGQYLQQALTNAKHQIIHYQILPDEPEQIRALMQTLCGRDDVEVVICNGGTGIAPRDTTYDAIAGLLDKTLPGFGELFRMLSFQEIGSRAMASRAIAGVCEGTVVFSLPGSSNAVRLAMEQLILPELRHLVRQVQG
ncbi:MAG: MogA/MoaB family molybdenum cofactor biosynthesis protein [Spirulina sp. SIO3F2]|nr:MogA/MoaB family molybdenum cofactor biosynthesis protein [Spirulina sp. SIO3F2]